MSKFRLTCPQTIYLVQDTAHKDRAYYAWFTDKECNETEVRQEYTRSDLVQRQIEEAVKDRWLALRNKIIDKLQDQITDDQLQEVLQIVDDEQWFPAIAEAIRNGEQEIEK